MNVYESLMRGLNEALEYERGNKSCARSVTLSTPKPVEKFNRKDIKRIRQKTGLSQVMFAWSIGVSPKTVEAWESGRNKPEGASRRMLEVIRDDPEFVKRFQTGPAGG